MTAASDAAAPPAAAVSVGRTRLGVVVFTAGAATLATEIAASRLLAPYFGSSTIVWANIIGLILLYLSIGYWLGGKVADRRPEPRLLGWMILVAAGAIALTPFIARPILDVTLRGLDAVSVGAVVGSFFAALALFAVPITLLGAVAPFAIRLALVDVREAGAVAGRLYALSTVGSIVGTFLSAIVTIPLLGTQRTMLGSAVLLVLAAALLLGNRWQLLTLAAAGLLFVPAGTIKASSGLLFETESSYQYIQIVERSDGSRALKLNEGVAVHSVWHENSVLTGGVWDTFLLVPPLLGRPVERMLVIGNAGGTVARAFGELYPDVEIDGVEIDPEVSEAARRYMGLEDNPRLNVITADGRPFLELTDETYDVIVVDAYHQPYIPFYLATREFFAAVREHLRPGRRRRPQRGERARRRAPLRGDREHAARRVPAGLALAAAPLQRAHARLRPARSAGTSSSSASRTLRPRSARSSPSSRTALEPVEAVERPLTDDRAPVEWLTDRMIIDFVARGGELDEDYLPTRP